MTDTTANRPEWQFHRYSTTRRHARGFLHFRVASAEYIDVKYRGQVQDVINTFDRNGEPTIYDRADFLAPRGRVHGRSRLHHRHVRQPVGAHHE